MGKNKVFRFIILSVFAALLLSTSFLGLDYKATALAAKKGATIVFAPVPEGNQSAGGKVIKNKKNTNSIIMTPAIESDNGKKELNNNTETH